MLIRNKDWDFSRFLRTALYWDRGAPSILRTCITHKISNGLKETIECLRIRKKVRNLGQELVWLAVL